MALCPYCRRHFRTMDDEPADECPFCGFTYPEPEPEDEEDDDADS